MLRSTNQSFFSIEYTYEYIQCTLYTKQWMLPTSTTQWSLDTYSNIYKCVGSHLDHSFIKLVIPIVAEWFSMNDWFYEDRLAFHSIKSSWPINRIYSHSTVCVSTKVFDHVTLACLRQLSQILFPHFRISSLYLLFLSLSLNSTFFVLVCCVRNFEKSTYFDPIQIRITYEFVNSVF